ncbi:uncharacterized protein [Periplaneta americana]|uniref:uncharacterized protein isoform X5 n=1 Tax=Periplaneta americana TaxID=6978 RepID=UPI0037E74245
MQFNKFTADCQRKLIIYQSVIFFHRVVMDVFKMEREIDPLAIERSNNTDVEEQKYLSEDGIKTDYGLKSEMAFDETLVPIDFPVVKSEVEVSAVYEEGNVLDLHVTEIKLECMDPTYDLKSEMTFEESPMPVDFPIVKRQAEEEQSDLDTVNEDPRVKVAAEDEIFTERMAGRGPENPGCQPNTTMIIYKTIIRPSILYASQLFTKLSPSIMSQLCATERRLARKAFNLLHNTNNQTVYNVTKIQPISQYNTQKNTKYIHQALNKEFTREIFLNPRHTNPPTSIDSILQQYNSRPQ